MFCPKCGNEYDDSWLHCTKCGMKNPFGGQPLESVAESTKIEPTKAPPPPTPKQAKSTSPPPPPPPTPKQKQTPKLPPLSPEGGTPGKPLSPKLMAAPSSEKHHPSASEFWRNLSGKGKFLVVGAGIAILALVVIVVAVSSGGNKSNDTSATSEGPTTTTEAEPSKTADDFIVTEINSGQEVTAGPTAVRGTVKSACTLTLNGQPVSADPNTKQFEVVVNINEGPNTLTFDITDLAGKTYNKSLSATGVLSPEAYKAVSPAGPPFANLEKNPDSFAGTRCKYTGKVVQAMESGGTTDIRMDITNSGYGFWTDTIYVTYAGTTPAVVDNIITVYGTIKGSHTYTSQANYEITLPLVEAKYIDVIQ